MKILLVNKLYYPWIGGVETFTRQIAEGLAVDKKNEVSILCCQAKGRTKKEVIGDVTILRAGSWGIVSSMPISFSFFYFFKKMIKEADVLDLQHPFPLAFLAVCLFRPKMKIVVHYHSDIVRQKVGAFLLRPIIKYVLRRAATIIVSNPNMVVSSDVLAEFADKCRVVHFGVDLKEIEVLRDESMIDENKKKYGKFILFVGRLNYYKGLNYLLHALKTVDINLVVVGEGKEKNNLLKLISYLDIGQKVFIVDNLPRKDLINLHFASELFVLPSIYKSETFGMVLLDAMACGKPVVTTEIGTGTSYVNVNNVTGLVVPPRNIVALNKAVEDILKNNEKNNYFSNQAKKRIFDFFVLDDTIKKNLEILKDNHL